MTKHEFIHALSELLRTDPTAQAVLEPSSKIRIYRGAFTLCYCPLTYVYVCDAQPHIDIEFWRVAARWLFGHYGVDLGYDIIDASDSDNLAELRAQLLQACGLQVSSYS